MKEYIERNAAVSVIAKISNESDMPVDWHKGMSVAMSAVCRIPAADVVPVRHGRWARIDYEPYGHDYICSVCGWKNDRASYYCPSCGARMDLGTDCTPDKDGD